MRSGLLFRGPSLADPWGSYGVGQGQMQSPALEKEGYLGGLSGWETVLQKTHGEISWASQWP